MNLIKLLCFFTFSLSIVSFAHSATFEKADLYGRWQCDHDFSQPQKNIKLNLNYNINFMQNGASEGFATLLFSMGGLPELKYREVDKALWSLKGDQLHIRSNNIQFINLNNPELEKLLNLQQLFPKSVDESVKILGLTNSTIKIQSDQHNEDYFCVRVNH